MRTADFLGILEVLADRDVDFIVVGALSAVIQGAPVTTFDLDIVHSRTPDNLDRLLSALESLNAYYRGHGERRLVPSISHIASEGRQLLSTDLGPLDVLGTIEGGLDYQDLLPFSKILTLDERTFTVLKISKYLAFKEDSHLEKDRARLPILRACVAQNPEDQ